MQIINVNISRSTVKVLYVCSTFTSVLPYPRSLEELAVYISKLEARWKTEPACTSDNESPEEVLIQGNSVLENCKKGFSELGDNCDYVRSGEERNDKIPARDSKAGRRLASKKSRSTGLKRAGKKEAAVMEEEVGCLKCHKDTNYKQVCSWGWEYGRKWVEEWGDIWVGGGVEERGGRGVGRDVWMREGSGGWRYVEVGLFAQGGGGEGVGDSTRKCSRFSVGHHPPSPPPLSSPPPPPCLPSHHCKWPSPSIFHTGVMWK